ncbi:alcohol dehydrogenase, partial (plasmid) [Kluyvera intermedia]
MEEKHAGATQPLRHARQSLSELSALVGTVAKLAMRQPFVLFKGLTFQKLCLP